MPIKSEANKPEFTSKISKFIISLGAVFAAIGVIFATIKAIHDSINNKDEKISLKIGWLTIRDPAALSCMISKPNTFNLVENVFIKFAENDCLSEIKSRIHSLSIDDLSKPQTVGKSYFLVLENKGPSIEKLAVFSKNESTTLANFRDFSINNSYAICMGYEGKGGFSSRTSLASHVTVKYKNQSKEIIVPDRTETTAVSVSSCDGITWNYPK